MSIEQVPLYTGYFSRIEEYKEKELYPISIARGTPKFAEPIDKYAPLMPTWELINLYKNTGDVEQYTKIYNSVILGWLTQEQTYNELVEITNNRPAILLCWENRDKFCHRHLVSTWLKEKYEITEYII